MSADPYIFENVTTPPGTHTATLSREAVIDQLTKLQGRVLTIIDAIMDHSNGAKVKASKDLIRGAFREHAAWIEYITINHGENATVCNAGSPWGLDESCG